jgi:exodeoxyribonuclease VII small subunit
MPETAPVPVADMSFEQALKELESIVQELEAGKVDLEKSIDIYERGEALKGHCERLLKEAEGRVERIRLGGNGKPTGTEPLDGEDAPF